MIDPNTCKHKRKTSVNAFNGDDVSITVCIDCGQVIYSQNSQNWWRYIILGIIGAVVGYVVASIR